MVNPESNSPDFFFRDDQVKDQALAEAAETAEAPNGSTAPVEV